MNKKEIEIKLGQIQQRSHCSNTRIVLTNAQDWDWLVDCVLVLAESNESLAGAIDYWVSTGYEHVNEAEKKLIWALADHKERMEKLRG